MRSFKYTNSKGSSINIGPNSVPTTLDNNLGSYWNANTLPDYPDNPSGTLYKSNFTLTTDSWYAYPSVALSVANNNLIFNRSSGSFAWRALSDFRGKSVCIGIRVKTLGDGSSTVKIEADTAAFGSQDSWTKSISTDGSWNTVSVTVGNYATASERLLVSLTSGTNYSLEIKLVYVGDGSYSSKMPDLSGNGRHLNVFGCTPVAGSVGKALSFNGNSYLRSEKVLDYIPDVWRFHIRFPFGIARAAENKTIFMYREQSNAGHIILIRPASSDNLTISYSNGTTYTTLAISSFFTGFISSMLDMEVEINFGASAVTLPDGTTLPGYGYRNYRNGSVFSTNILTTPVKPAIGDYLYIGSYNGTQQFLPAIAEGFAVGSGALTAAEHWSLYSNYSAPYKTTGETSYGIVESVEGIDYADSDLQTTKAPYQDGTTYLDTLLSPRDITIEGIIPVPNAIDTINTHRKAILDIFNAKYGTGILDYYYGLNTIQHKVLKNVTVNSVKFANRVMPEPTQRYQINLTAQDPYFYDSQYSPYAINILSGTSRTLTVGGENDTPCFIRIYGAATNPTITNATTGEVFSLTYTLASGSYIDIDTTFGNKSVKLNGSTNLIGYVDLASTFFQLPIGSPVLSYSGGGDITVMWYNKYIGV